MQRIVKPRSKNDPESEDDASRVARFGFHRKLYNLNLPYGVGPFVIGGQLVYLVKMDSQEAFQSSTLPSTHLHSFLKVEIG